MAVKQRIPPFGLRMPDDLKEWVRETAQKEGRSRNNLVLHLLESAGTSAVGEVGASLAAAE